MAETAPRFIPDSDWDGGIAAPKVQSALDTKSPPSFIPDTDWGATPDPAAAADDDGVTFAESFGRGVDIMQGMGFGAVEAAGEAVDSRELAKIGRAGRERNIEEMGEAGPRARVTEIRSFGDLGQWAKEIIGEQLPIMAPSIAGGLAGGALGALAGPGAPAAIPIGAAIGAFIPSAVLGTGETQMAIKEIDPEAKAPGYAFAGGTAIGALDAIVPGKLGSALLKRFGRETAEKIAKRALEKPLKDKFIKRTAKGGAAGMATEGFTEAFQEAISETTAAAATGTEVDVAKMTEQMVEAGAAGALMGGGAGAVTGAVQRGPAAPAEPAPEDVAPTEPAPQQPQEARETPPAPAVGDMPAGFQVLYDEDGETPVGMINMDTGEQRMTGATSSPEEIEAARERVETTPSEAQKKAGNYRKGPIKFQGRQAMIETAVGEERTGEDADGKPWTVTMPADYGYYKRTEGADGDQLDGYFGDNQLAEYVYVIDQIDSDTREFDEHKIMAGFSSESEARAIYNRGFSDDRGDERLGAITPLTQEQFDDFVENGDLKSALAYDLETPGAGDRRPATLLAFARQQGGVRDPGGDLRAMDAVRQRPGLINNQAGVTLDDLGEAAFEMGYFDQRPTVSELLERMTDELGGRSAFTPEGQQIATEQVEAAEAEDWVRQADILGLDYAPDAAVDDIRGMVLVERNRLETEHDSLETEVDDMIQSALEQTPAEEQEAYAQAVEEIPFTELAVTTEPSEGDRPVDAGRPSEGRAGDEGGPAGSARPAEAGDVAGVEDIDLTIPDFLRRKRQFRPEQGRSAAERQAAEPSPEDTEESQSQPPGEDPDVKYQTAWHGGPHDFDEFSTEHIGKGEGAQAYGWGLYFASKEGVARFYRDNLSGASDTPALRAVNAELPARFQGSLDGARNITQAIQDAVLSDPDVKTAADYLNQYDVPAELMPAYQKAIENLESRGRLYRVNLAPAEDEYLLWDKPLNEQSAKVQAALTEALTPTILDDVQELAENYGINGPESATDPDYTGRHLYQALTKLSGEGPYFDVADPNAHSAKAEVSIWLKEHGVPGVKYLDASSRKPAAQGGRFMVQGGQQPMAFDMREEAEAHIEQYGGDLTERSIDYNYVIFDESLVEIEEKFQKAGLSPSMGWARNETGVREGLKEILQQIAPTAKLAIVDDLIDGKARGKFEPLRQLITVALNQGDPYQSLRHEAMHFFVEAGVFTDQEWALLEREAPGWVKELNIDQQYRRLSQGAQREEAIAEKFANWTPGVDAPSAFARIIARIQDFLSRLGNLLRGYGFRTVDDIFIMADRGEIGRRPPRQVDSPSETPKYARARQNLFGASFAVPSTYVRDYFNEANLTFVQRTYNAAVETGRHLRVKFQDNAHRLEQLQKIIEQTRGFVISESHDAYLAFEIWMGRAGKQLTEFKQWEAEPLIKRINDNGFTLEQVENFLYARHAPERNAQIAKINPELPDGGSGMTDADAAAIIQAAKDDGTHAKLEAIGRTIDKITAETMRVRLNLGLIDDITHKLWTDAYKHFVPLQGFAETDETDLMLADRDRHGARIGRGFDIRGEESRRALGRHSRAGELLATTFTLREEAIVRGRKNEALRALVKLVQQNPNPNLWEMDAVDYVPKLNRTTGLVEYGPQTFRALRSDEIAVKVQGKVHYIRFHGDFGAQLLRLFTNSGGATNNIVIQQFARLNRYFAWINTSLNPEFMLGNWIRDAGMASINMSPQAIRGLQRRVFRDVFKALRGAYGGLQGNRDTVWERRFHEFGEAGGKIEFFGLKGIEEQRAEIENTLNDLDPTNWRKVDMFRRKAFKFIENANGAVENAVRLSLFHHLVDSGVSQKKAASVVRNITVNFNRRGEYGALFNSFFLFYNASIQGSTVVIKALRHRKVRQAVGGIIVAHIMLDIINAMMSPEDDDGVKKYDKINDWTKSHNIIIGNWWGTDADLNPVALKIPMPYGYNVFGVIGYKIAEIIRGKTSPLEAAAGVANSTWQAFNPLGGESDAIGMIVPTILKPWYEWKINQNFLGNPIRPTANPFDDAPRPESEMHFKSVTAAFKSFTGWLNTATGGSAIRPGAVDVSPELLDHLLDFFVGGAGAFVRRNVDFVHKGVMGEPITWNNLPFARRIIEGNNLYYDTGKYRDLKSAVSYARKERKHFVRQRDSESLQQLRERHGPEIGMIGTLKQTEKRLRGIRRARSRTQRRRDLPASVKKQMVEKYNEREKQTVRIALKRYRSLLDAEKARKR